MSYTFNGNNLESYVAKVEEVRRTLLPAVNNVVYRIPGRDGERHIRTTLGSSLIEVDVRLIEDSKEDLQDAIRALAGILYTTEPAKLEVNEPNKHEMAILDGTIDVHKMLDTGGATLRFLVPEAASYGTEQTVAITGGDITNTGTYQAEGVVTVTFSGPAADLEVKNVTTGERVYIEHEFVASDVVTVYLGDNEAVEKNGSSIMDDVSLDSDFFRIPVGTFKLTVSAGTGVLEYTDRWV